MPNDQGNKWILDVLNEDVLSCDNNTTQINSNVSYNKEMDDAFIKELEETSNTLPNFFKKLTKLVESG